jgi:hydroxypyruvate isomerase
MPRFAANLTMLFTELPFLDRFEAAAKAGFKGVEYLFPYDFSADELAARLKQHGLVQVLHNLPAGDWAKGERGIAIFADRTDEFRSGVERAITYATALGCKQLNCLAGIAPEGADRAALEAAFIANLAWAAQRLKAAGIKLLIEAINPIDIPGFFLITTRQSLDVIARTGSDNIFVQYDIYHMQITEGDLARTMERNLAMIPHIQLADNPGRHEPGTGEINYSFLFSHLDRIGYGGWIGCEYKPKAGTNKSLGWFTALGSSTANAE